MNHHDLKRIALVFAMAIALVLLAGCNVAEELVQPGPDAEAEVTMGAQTGALAGPSGDTAGDMIAGMIGLTCPETFELPNGISGTCSTGEAGVMAWLFGGAILVDGDSVEVDGSMTATLSAEQPETGASYDIDYSASAFGTRGSGSWVSSGAVLFTATGELLDYDLEMIHTITPAGGETAVVHITVDPSILEMSITGPMGGTIGFVLGRETMTGTLSLNGIPVATVSIEDGCATIVSIIPAIPDKTICAGAG